MEPFDARGGGLVVRLFDKGACHRGDIGRLRLFEQEEGVVGEYYIKVA